MLSAQNTCQDFFPQKEIKNDNKTIQKVQDNLSQKNLIPQNDLLNIELEKIQKQIDNVANQLDKINKKMQQEQKNQGKYAKFASSYLTLQRQRNNLRKQLIDLDFQHKQIYFQIVNQNKNRKNQKILYQAQNQQKQKLQQEPQRLNSQVKNQKNEIQNSQHVRFYQNSQIALDASRTEIEKSKEFFNHNRYFSFSNVNRIDSIQMKHYQNQIDKVIVKKQINYYPLKQNLFQKNERINSHRQREKLKTYQLQVRLDLQRQKLQKRLKDLNSYHYLKSKQYETIQTRRFPSLCHGLYGWKSIYNPMRFY